MSRRAALAVIAGLVLASGCPDSSHEGRPSAARREPRPRQAAEPGDPVVVEVNLRTIRLSEMRAALRAEGEAKRALRKVLERALLLQEADHSGLGGGLPAEPDARARAFLERVVSRRVVCGNITDGEIRQMYAVMRPRFVRGELFRVADLQWRCGAEGRPEEAGCETEAEIYAGERWRPIAGSVRTAADLYWLGMLERRRELHYVEYTFHVDPAGRASVSDSVLAAVAGLEPGTAAVSDRGSGSRIHLLLERRPPEDRALGSPGVRDEVIAELCPRLLEQSRKHYLDGLVGSARVVVHEELLRDP